MGGIVLLYGKRVLLNVDDQYTQYGFGKSAKCDIGVGQVKMRLAILSLDPETKGDLLEFINIRDDVTGGSVDFSSSNNFILLTTFNKWEVCGGD